MIRLPFTADVVKMFMVLNDLNESIKKFFPDRHLQVLVWYLCIIYVKYLNFYMQIALHS
jgi:hypothetical protein